MKVLLVGHPCSPDEGSEMSFTWNWAWHLSKHHQVWVFTHPACRSEIERHLMNQPNPNLRMVWVTPPRILDPWRPGRGIARLHLHYLMWQHAVLRAAKHLHEIVDFDIAHHVTLSTVSAPPLLWKLPIPLIWGPIGGGENPPASFRRYFGPEWPSQVLRTLRVLAVRFLPPVRQAAQRSAALLASNAETSRLLKVAGAQEVIYFIDSGIPSSFVRPAPRDTNFSSTFNLLWVGKFIRRKALPLALEALSQVTDLPVRLLIAGDGPMRRQWINFARRLGLGDRAQFLGRVEWRDMPALYEQANAFIFTSLRDSFGTQVIEAMAQSLPIVTLDHQGVGEFIPNSAGLKVPVTSPKETVTALAQAIRRLAESPELCWKMGESAWNCALGQTWDNRAERMSRLYDKVLNGERRVSGREVCAADGPI